MHVLADLSKNWAKKPRPGRPPSVSNLANPSQTGARHAVGNPARSVLQLGRHHRRNQRTWGAGGDQFARIGSAGALQDAALHPDGSCGFSAGVEMDTTRKPKTADAQGDGGFESGGSKGESGPCRFGADDGSRRAHRLNHALPSGRVCRH